MNAREMIYKPLSSKSIEPCRHNGPLHYMQMIGNVQYLKLNMFYTVPRGGDKRPPEDPASASFPSVFTSTHDGGFYLEAGGRDVFE